MNLVYKLGFYISILTAIVTTATFVIAVLTPPLSGPLCVGSCFSYPFSDIGTRFPRDYYWMYPAMLISILFIVLMLTARHAAPDDKKIFANIGTVFAIAGALVLFTDFFLQLSVVQPSLLKGEADGVAMLSQFNPHGVFIVLEELGYLLISFGLFFMAFIFAGTRLAKSIRWTYLVEFFFTVFSLLFFIAQYGVFREYRFEIAAISIFWTCLIVSSILLAFYFRRLNAPTA